MVIIGGNLKLKINKQGQLTSLVQLHSGYELLTNPGYSAVEECGQNLIIGGSGSSYCSDKIQIKNENDEVQITRPFSAFGIVMEDTFISQKDVILWQVKVTTIHKEPATAHVYMVLPALGQDRNLFIAHHDGPLKPDDFHHTRYLYGGDQFRGELGRAISLPLISFYTHDLGLTCAAPAGLSVPAIWYSFFHEVSELGFVAKHINFRLDSDTPVTVQMLLRGHGGSWQEGVSWYKERFNSYFSVKGEGIFKSEGAMLCSPRLHSPGEIDIWKKQGFAWQELHANLFPCYGNYSPQEDSWQTLAHNYDVKNLDLTKLAKLDPLGVEYSVLTNYPQAEEMSKQKIRDYIELLHQNGVAAFMYINPVLCDKHLLHQFEDSAAKNADGTYCAEGYYFGVSMNPDPDLGWGRYILSQVEGILEDYPNCDGIFFDELHYRHWDFAHDDGVTMVNNKPCYMLGFAMKRLAERIGKLVHARGKAVWGNGPTSLEVMEHIDGYMAEHSSTWMGTIQYYGLEKPMVLLFGDQPVEVIKEGFKKLLLCGGQPDVLWKFDLPRRLSGDNKQTRPLIPAADSQRMELCRSFAPLLKQIKGRSWVLHPQPLQLPEKVQGNVFQRLDDAVVVTVSSDIKVIEVRIGVAKEVLAGRQKALLYTTDQPEPETARVEEDGNWIWVMISELSQAAVVVFSQN
jgi:hypothetical protein